MTLSKQNVLFIYEDEEIYMKRMSNCPISQVNQCWNEGFDDSYTKEFGVSYQFSLDVLLARIAIDQLNLRYSVVAFCKKTDRAIGLIASGIRTLKGGVVISWNGSTTVIPEYRRKGIGRKLMAIQFDLYKESNVDIATIEVIPQNTKAMNLYKGVGFEELGDILNLTFSGILPPILNTDQQPPIKLRTQFTNPLEIGKIEYYPLLSQYQTQYQSLELGGEGIVVYEDKGGKEDDHHMQGEVIGYALLRKRYDNDLNISGISLRQIQPKPNHPHYDYILLSLLSSALLPHQNCFRQIFLPPSMKSVHEKVQKVLNEIGFKKYFDIVSLQKKMN